MSVPHFSRRLLLVLGAGLPVVLVMLLAVVAWSDRAGATSSRSATSRSYSDVDHRSLPPGTPDVKRVTVTRTAGGLVTFRLVFAKAVRITDDFGSEVFIDADRSQRTGDKYGWDYTLDYSPTSAHVGPSLAMLVWTRGKEYEVTRAKAKSLRFYAAARSVVFQVASRDLGVPLAYRLRKGHTIPSLPQLGDSFDFDTVTSAHWLKDAAGVDRAGYWTFPDEGQAGTAPPSHKKETSILALSVVLACLLVALVVLVVGQLAAKRAWPSTTEGGGTRSEKAVWAASAVALFGAFLGGIAVAVPFALLRGSVPDAVVTAAVFICGLVPCVVLGYRSGRWWSFVGAAPMLVLWPLGLVVGSTSEDVLTNADLFLALPVTAAMAVALSLGSALRLARKRGRPARHHRLLPT